MSASIFATAACDSGSFSRSSYCLASASICSRMSPAFCGGGPASGPCQAGAGHPSARGANQVAYQGGHPYQAVAAQAAGHPSQAAAPAEAAPAASRDPFPSVPSVISFTPSVGRVVAPTGTGRRSRSCPLPGGTGARACRAGGTARASPPPPSRSRRGFPRWPSVMVSCRGR